jgi:hypothetical protein
MQYGAACALVWLQLLTLAGLSARWIGPPKCFPLETDLIKPAYKQPKTRQTLHSAPKCDQTLGPTSALEPLQPAIRPANLATRLATALDSLH